MRASQSYGRRIGSLLISMLVGASLIAATAGFAATTLKARWLVEAIASGWFAGGLGGVLFWASASKTRHHAILGYFAGLAMSALATAPLNALAMRSPYSARGAMLIAIVYLLVPFAGAAVALGLAEPDRARAFGLAPDPERLGKYLFTWRVLPWLLAPALVCASVAWGVGHTPADRSGRPYGPGSRACRTSADCHLLTTCENCGGCFSIEPNWSFDCDAICEPRKGRYCACVNRQCVAMQSR